jgi:predicted amidohydrolase YtcJ
MQMPWSTLIAEHDQIELAPAKLATIPLVAATISSAFARLAQVDLASSGSIRIRSAAGKPEGLMLDQRRALRRQTMSTRDPGGKYV